MRFFLISDNIDTLMGLRLVGVDGVVVHSEVEVRETFSKVINDSRVALIMVTDCLVDLCRDYIYGLKFSGRTQIVQIPDRHGSKTIGGVHEYLKNALGIGVS